MDRKYAVIPLLTLIVSLVLSPCSTFAADPHQYDFRWVSSTPLADLPAAYLAESPEQGFDAWIAPDGVRVRAVDGTWRVGLAFVAVGRDGAMKEAAPAGAEAHGNRAELHRGSLTEWYVNDERGLEQGFTLEERPAGTAGSELVLELELTGNLMPLVAGDGRRLDLLRPGNLLPVLVYSGLAVVDAEGLELPARLELGAGTESGGRRLWIVVADANAVYPVTVDPLLTTAVWSSSDTDLTYSVAWGDWDGDGDLDLAAGNSGVNRVYENDGLGQSGSLTLVWTSAEADPTVSIAWGDWDGDGDLDLAAGNHYDPNRVYENGWLRRPGGLPENPVSPALPDRPGATDAAFFFSVAKCLESPVTVDYMLTDDEADPALRIVSEYSVVGRAGWQPATEGPGGSGTTNLTADPDGRDHTFVWDSSADSVLWDHAVRFRITVPHQASTHVAGPIVRGAMSAVSPPFRICDIPADIAVTKNDGVTQVTLGQLLTYTITVSHNAGVGTANGVRVIDIFPAALTGMAWICLEDGGGSCDVASGSGDIDTFVNLPVGTHVTFLAAGTVTADASDGLTNTVEVLASPVAPDPNLANNTATDIDQGWGGIFADGFETGDTSAWSMVVP